MRGRILGVIILVVILVAAAYRPLRDAIEDPVLVSVSYPLAVHVSGLERSAALGIIPATESHPVGNEFAVQVYVDTTRMSINAIEATILYPTERLKVIRVSREDSIFSLWPAEPTFSNDDPSGRVHFVGGTPNPGFLGNLGIIMDIEFEVIEEGVSVVEFREAQVLANNGFGTDILQELRPAIFTTRRIGIRKADIDGDGAVGFGDLSIVLANLNKDPKIFMGDVNADGRISFQDVSIVLAEWGN